MPDGEVNELLKKAHGRLEAAQLLHSDGFYEDAISRAYYAMFYAARSLLTREGVIVKTHRGIIAKIGEIFVKNGQMSPDTWKLFAYGETLRESAEYGGEMTISQISSDTAIRNAIEFILVCEKIIEDI